MKYGEAESWLRLQLQNIYDKEEAAAMTTLILEHITGFPRMERITKNDAVLEKKQLEDLHAASRRLLQHEPLQYVIGETYFAGSKLFVDKNVLIPRPETEELVQWIIDDMKAAGKDVFERRPGEADLTNSLKIIDVGTGSGCIALALKAAMPKAEVWACDTSDKALNIARRNGSALDVRVDFVGLDFLDHLQRKQLPTVDVIVSNPPYIPQNEKENMQPNVVAHEPHLALFVPDNDALIFYKALATFGKERLYENGAIYCEINEDAATDAMQLFSDAGYKNIVVKKDMQGKNRMVKATLSS